MTITNLFLQDPVDPGVVCPHPKWGITQYQISFQTLNMNSAENVNLARCTARRCSHTFEPPSNPPSSYDSVSVAAENVVGVGATRTCTTKAISEFKFDYDNIEGVLVTIQGCSKHNQTGLTIWVQLSQPWFSMYADTTNNLLTGEVIYLSSDSNSRLNCAFLSGFTGSDHCTVQYGIDSTYMNLPYSSGSTETGTAGDTVSVVLRERLNSSTEYYYTVSAVSGDVTVRVHGKFTTYLYSKH